MKSLYSFFILYLLVHNYSSSQSIQNQISEFVEHQMNEFHIPAVSVAVIDNGNIVFQQAFGLAIPEYNIPNTDTTAFQLASVTKLISATALMTLVQDERLDLRKSVRYYLPELPESWQNMHVEDLVSHQSGIADLLALKFNFSSLKEALDTATARPLDFEPGTKTVYAGGDYAVVMHLIESVSGVSFQEFLKQGLLERLEMNHTVYNNMSQDYIYRTYDLIPYVAPVYVWDSNQNQQRLFSMMFPSWTYPAGGLYSSIDDLSKWVVALDKNTLLKPEIEERLWTATKLRDGKTSPFGVGWIVDQHNGEKATGHSGGPALADIVRLPSKKLTVIVLTNQLSLRPFLAMRILDIHLENKN